MRIAIVVGSFPVITQSFIINQITELIDRGHDVHVFSYEKNQGDIIHQKVKVYQLDEKTIYLNGKFIGKLTRYIYFFKFLFFNRRKINFHKIKSHFNFKEHGIRALNLSNYTKYKWILDHAPFDIIHAHFGMDAIPIAEMRALGYFANTGFVTSFHGYDISPHLMDIYPEKYKLLFEEVDLLIANTSYTKSLLQKITDPGKISVLPVGLNTKEFVKRNSYRDEVCTLLFVGRLIEFKAPHIAIEIIKNLVNRGYHKIRFLIVGDGELRKQLQNSIRTYRLKTNVELLGPLPQEDIIQIMDKSDIFLFPGIYDKSGRAENQGLVLQEAQAMQLPVVISDAGGMMEGIIDGETGFVVQENNIDDFADKLEYLINNKEERVKMGERGRIHVAENYDSVVIGKKLVEKYKKMIKR